MPPTFPHISRAKPLMVVVDTSVFLHRLNQVYQLEPEDPQLESIIKANLVWLMSGAWLGHELRPLLANIVFVKDVKPYWRSEWLADIYNTIDLPRKGKALQERATAVKAILAKGGAETNEERELIEASRSELTVAYKAGRKFPDKTFTKLRNRVYKHLDDLGASQLSRKGYEADDMAAALVATNTAKGNPWSILLLTVDTDWLGLVNPAVTWCCMSGFAPVVRDTLEVCNSWVVPRLKVSLDTWADIWKVKGDQGDKSDNLPKSEGLLLPVIDLLEPPSPHKVWLTDPALVAAKFSLTAPRFNLEEAKSAQNHLKLNGLRPVVKMLPEQQLEPPKPLDFGSEVLTGLFDLLDSFKPLPEVPEGVF